MSSLSDIYKKVLPPFAFGRRGFSLIEISIVLVIIGIVLSMGIGMMKSLTRTSSVKKVRTSIELAENALISFALSRGRLPCPDTDGDGVENCPVSTCSNPPCALPYMDLQVQGTDAWAQSFRYDVTDILATTNSQNLCVVLYELMNFYVWSGSPANSPCGGYSMVCATSVSDSLDNGRIASAGSGYYLSAYIVSCGEDTVLGGKNRNSSRSNREYELASNPYDITAGRDDLVGELTFSRLYNGACSPASTRITVMGNDVDGDGIVVNYSIDHGGCTPLLAGQSLSVFQGQQAVFYPDNETSCTSSAPHLTVDFYDGSHSSTCSAGADMIDCDTSGSAWNGKIAIDGNSNGSVPVMSDI